MEFRIFLGLAGLALVAIAVVLSNRRVRQQGDTSRSRSGDVSLVVAVAIFFVGGSLFAKAILGI